MNRFVQHDFENYKRTLSKHLLRHFADKKVEDSDIEKARSSVKEKFDSTYPFPQDAYKYIFYFLEIIYSLKINNAVFPFESFEDIKDCLRKQWAGFFYDSLTKERTVAIEKVELLGKRLDKIELHLRSLAESGNISQDKNKLTIDIKRLASEFNISDLEGIQEKIHELMYSLMYTDYRNPRLKLHDKMDAEKALKWVTRLNTLIQDYKWSQFIPITEIMTQVKYVYWKDRTEVLYKTLFELCSIFNGLDVDDKNAFLNTISLELNKLYEPEPETETTTDLEPF